tara:strand:- start:381 stop:1091 length:711 start_codon:yes stop_codon:yes gene_type:complete
MAIKNLSLQTIGLHVGYKDYSKITAGQIPYKKPGILTCSGISIFGDLAGVGGLATVTVGPPDSGSSFPFTNSLHIAGNSRFQGNITQVGDYTLTGDITISGTMKAGFATWSSSIVATSKLFDIKHPSKTNHRLAHASLEGPEIGVYYRGRLKGSNKITLPEYWKDLVHKDSITVDITPIGHDQNIFVKEFDNEKIIIEVNSLHIDCFYHVYGERKDVDKLKVEYKGDTILEQGKPK